MKERSIQEFADKQGLKRRIIHAPECGKVKMTDFGKCEKGHRARDLARGSYLFRVTEDILVAMEDLGVTKSELARRLGKSKPRITQLLSGSSNMTIGTLSDIAAELGLNLDKTFKEYSVQRYRLDTGPSSKQALTDPELPIASIK